MFIPNLRFLTSKFLRFFSLILLILTVGCATKEIPQDTCESAYQDFKTKLAILLCEKEAEAGKPEAMMLLSSIYFQGLGVEKNHQLSAKWLLEASSLGYCDAQAKYALFLIKGLGINKDMKAGTQMLLRTWESGCKEATSSLEALTEEVLEKNYKNSRIKVLVPDSFQYFAVVERQNDWHPELFKLSLTIHQPGPVPADPDIGEYMKHFHFVSGVLERRLERKLYQEPLNTFSWTYYMVPKNDQLYFPEVSYAGNSLKPKLR